MTQATLSIRGATLSVRAADTPVGVSTLSGYAALFDVPSQSITGDEGPPFTEVIRKGAFARALAQGQDVRALWNHDASLVLGRSSNGTLALLEDDRGLSFVITPPDTSWARDLITLVERGDVSQCSFSFSVKGEKWSVVNGAYLRELSDVDLYDVGPVTYPAYLSTTVGVRSVRVPADLFVPVAGLQSMAWARARLRVATL